VSFQSRFLYNAILLYIWTHVWYLPSNSAWTTAAPMDTPMPATDTICTYLLSDSITLLWIEVDMSFSLLAATSTSKSFWWFVLNEATTVHRNVKDKSCIANLTIWIKVKYIVPKKPDDRALCHRIPFIYRRRVPGLIWTETYVHHL
jgi:hypothetical protein